MPEFGDVRITGNLTVDIDARINGNSTFQGNTLVNGNSTFQGNTLVSGNSTFQGDTLINGNSTFQGDTQTNGNTTTQGHAQVLKTIRVGENLIVNGNGAFSGGISTTSDFNAGNRLMATKQPATNPNDFIVQEVRFYEIPIPGQPGLVLKGTDGQNYLIFIDNSGGVGNPNIGIQKA
ncbi:hypothetical protein [Paenibacillus sp. HJGM_3]|uniref:hypothetical protein n=1 Tax=Paenibacillus sp. HJGM_3 TaxID=3379816 RepID=UPI0038703333